MRQRYRAAGAGTLSLLFAGCFLLPREEKVLAPPLMEAPEITYQTVRAERGVIENVVVVTGYFVYPQQQSVYFQHRSGPLRNIYVGIGHSVIAGQVVAELDTDSLVLDIAQQEINLRKAELRLQRSRALGADSFTLQISELEVDAARLRLRQLQGELTKSQLLAPFSGEVVYVARLDEGAFVPTFRTIVQIADPRERLLSYGGFNRSDFRAGMSVSVSIRGEPFSGEVLWTPLNAPPDATEEMKELVLIRVNDLPPEVEKGDSATVSLVLERKENAVVVPRNLVQTYLGRRFVYVFENGLRQERNVAVGIQTPTRAEILDGLEDGETLVIR